MIIIKGPYPQNEDEIEILRKNGVCAVLNIQTHEELNNIYDQKNIFFKNYQICDESADLADKLPEAAHLLHELVQKFEVKTSFYEFTEFYYFRKFMFIVQQEFLELRVLSLLIYICMRIILLIWH